MYTVQQGARSPALSEAYFLVLATLLANFAAYRSEAGVYLR